MNYFLGLIILLILGVLAVAASVAFLLTWSHVADRTEQERKS